MGAKDEWNGTGVFSFIKVKREKAEAEKAAKAAGKSAKDAGKKGGK